MVHNSLPPPSYLKREEKIIKTRRRLKRAFLELS
jgi:hypothetical protein